MQQIRDYMARNECNVSLFITSNLVAETLMRRYKILNKEGWMEMTHHFSEIQGVVSGDRKYSQGMSIYEWVVQPKGPKPQNPRALNA